MNKEIEIANDGLPVLADDQLVTLVANAEKRIEAFSKLKQLAIRLTHAGDWVAEGDRPYMQSYAAEKIGSFFGVSWHIDEPTFEQEESGHFTYTYQGKFWWRGNEITAIGTRSSKDGFFKKYKYLDKQRIELPVSEIDRGDVKKSAYTNCIGNGVTRSLGIRNLTWEDLTAYAGITKEQVQSIQYKKSGKQQTEIASEDAETVIVGVSDVRKKTGQKNGKEWTAYTIICNGIEYKTFSETIAKTAKEARDAGLQIEITFKKSQYGNNIETIRKIEPPAKQVEENQQ